MLKAVEQFKGRRFATILVGLVALTSTPLASADPTYKSLPPVIWAADSFQLSPLGFQGCLKVDGAATRYCFIAHTIPEGPEAGSVRFVTEIIDSTLFSPHFEQPEIYEEIVPAGTLSSSPGPWEPNLTMKANLMGVGDVDVTTIALSGRSRISTGPGCQTDPIQYSMVAAEASIIDRIWFVTGTVEGRRARYWRCVSYFLRPTSGEWAMPTGFLAGT